MTPDKRAVTTDALETLGTILPLNADRDAIHLAVEPVIAACVLRPGDHIGIMPDHPSINGHCHVGYTNKPIGIVDPFLQGTVQPGQVFWMVIYPRKITSLRHVWTHPDIDTDIADMVLGAIAMAPVSLPNPKLTDKELSVAYIANLAHSYESNYFELLSRAKVFLTSGEYWYGGEKFDGEYLPDAFWDHYEKVTGETVPEELRRSFFSCSC